MAKNITQFDIMLRAKPFNPKDAKFHPDGRVSVGSLDLGDTGYVYHYPRVHKCVILDITEEAITVWLISDDECDADNFEDIDVDPDSFVSFFAIKKDCEEYSKSYYECDEF